MYLGRIVAVARNQQGCNAAFYRVSSRSFPNRQVVSLHGNLAVVPRAGFEGDLAKNPYITYNCARLAGDYAIVTNGSQTDPITEKIASGMPVRDAVALGLLALDYEHDSLDTPRIVAVVHKTAPEGVLGVVGKGYLLVRTMKLENGKAFYLSTYEKNFPCEKNCDAAYNAKSAAEACAYGINGGVFADFEHPVTAAAAFSDGNAFQFASQNV